MGDEVTTSAPHRSFVKTKSESGSEDVHYHLIYEDLPEEFKLVAERELNETENNRKRGLEQLKDYLNKKNLPLISDEPLLAVLRACKYDTKKSKAKLTKFMVARKEAIKQLAELGVEKREKIIDDMPVGALPYRDKHGRAIFYARIYAFNLESYELQDAINVYAGIALFALCYQITSVAGVAHVGDDKSPSFYLHWCWAKAAARNMLRVISFPIRVARVEYLNENFVTRWFMKLVKPILSQKIIGRISLHGSDLDALHENYHPDILPEEFGGNMGPLSNEAYRQKFLDLIRDLIEESPDAL